MFDRLITDFYVFTAIVIIYLKNYKFFHEFAFLFFSWSIVYLVYIFMLDAHHLLNRFFIRIFSKRLNDYLLTLNVDAHPIVRYFLWIIIDLLASLDNLFVLKSSSQQIGTIRSFYFAASTYPKITVSAFLMLLHKFVMKIVVVAQAAYEWAVIEKVCAFTATSVNCVDLSLHPAHV